MPSKLITEGYKVFALCDIDYTFDWIFTSRVDSAGNLLQSIARFLEGDPVIL